MSIHFWAHLTSSAHPSIFNTKSKNKNSSLVRPQPPAILWSPLPKQCSSRIKNNFWTLTLSSKNQTSQSVSPCIPELLSHHPVSTCPHNSFSPSLASFTSLRPLSLFMPSSPQQLINATSSHSIIRATFLLYFPSPTAREQHFPCILCTTSTNLIPKMIKSAALINECDGWINSRTLISESGIHTKYTTIESLFGHSLSDYRDTRIL